MKAIRAGPIADGGADPSDRQHANDSAIGLLKRAIAAGSRNPDYLKNDPELRPLRDRAGFPEPPRSIGSRPDPGGAR